LFCRLPKSQGPVLKAVIIALMLACVSAAPLSAEGQDSVSISSIVPYTGHYILTPSKFVYTMSITYSLKSSLTGFISMKVFRVHDGRKEMVATTTRMPVRRGEATVMLRSTDILVKAGAERDPGGLGRLRVEVELLSREGRTLASVQSENHLTGELFAEYKGTVSNTDYLQVLSVQPAPGTFLQAGIRSPFEIKFAYNAPSANPVYAIMRFGNISGPTDMVYMRDYFLPVPRGRGVLSVRIPTVTLPAAKRGDTVGINIILFNSSSSKAVSNVLIWPYNLVR